MHFDIVKKGKRMAQIDDKKVDKALDGLLSRQDYLVTQANDLARSFGNLSTFEHKVLDFCFSSVQKNDYSRTMYKINSKDILRHLGLNLSGRNYERVVKAFKVLNEKTAIYMLTTMSDGSQGILMTSLFDHIAIGKSGLTEFRFSEDVAPFVFQLKQHFYSFKLSELARVRSKYTLTLMKLWNANSMGKLRNATIQGDMEEWQSWFIGSDEEGKPKHWTASRFKQQVLRVALKELGELYPETVFTLTTITNGRKVEGYRLDIHPISTNLEM